MQADWDNGLIRHVKLIRAVDAADWGFEVDVFRESCGFPSRWESGLPSSPRLGYKHYGSNLDYPVGKKKPVQTCSHLWFNKRLECNFSWVCLFVRLFVCLFVCLFVLHSWPPKWERRKSGSWFHWNPDGTGFFSVGWERNENPPRCHPLFCITQEKEKYTLNRPAHTKTHTNTHMDELHERVSLEMPGSNQLHSSSTTLVFSSNFPTGVWKQTGAVKSRVCATVLPNGSPVSAGLTALCCCGDRSRQCLSGGQMPPQSRPLL